MLTVGELLEALKEFPPDTPVVMSKDAEGNGFSPLADLGVSMYSPYNTYSGEIYPTPETVAADPRMTEEDEAPEDAVRVVVLWPTN